MIDKAFLSSDLFLLTLTVGLYCLAAPSTDGCGCRCCIPYC